MSDVDAEFDIQDLSYENASQYLETITYYLSETDFLGISVSEYNPLVSIFCKHDIDIYKICIDDMSDKQTLIVCQ